jgi:hypothetical protein
LQAFSVASEKVRKAEFGRRLQVLLRKTEKRPSCGFNDFRNLETTFDPIFHAEMGRATEWFREDFV